MLSKKSNNEKKEKEKNQILRIGMITMINTMILLKHFIGYRF